jgi:cyclopropane fatty-acyl-phospholipid synthase-like methyltransferase
MYVDDEALRGWTEASRRETVNAHIHPAGVKLDEYIESGKRDAIEVLKWVKPEDYVMDYGCGNGRVLKFIPNKRIGIDAVKEMAVFVKTPEEFEGKVDVIYSISVFIHNSFETGVNIIKWMKEHIKPGGLLLLQIPIYDVAKNPENWTDVGVWTERMFREATEGLEIVELHKNKGSFSFESIGKNHAKFQILKA